MLLESCDIWREFHCRILAVHSWLKVFNKCGFTHSGSGTLGIRIGIRVWKHMVSCVKTQVSPCEINKRSDHFWWLWCKACMHLVPPHIQQVLSVWHCQKPLSSPLDHLKFLECYAGLFAELKFLMLKINLVHPVYRVTICHTLPVYAMHHWVYKDPTALVLYLVALVE